MDCMKYLGEKFSSTDENVKEDVPLASSKTLFFGTYLR